MITEQFSTAPQTKTRSLLICFVLNCFFFFLIFFWGEGSINSDYRGKIYSALKVLKELRFQDQGTNSKKGD